MDFTIKPKERNVDRRTIPHKLSYTLLDMICSYIVSENSLIKTKGYKNIQELINILDLSMYTDDEDIERLDFIRFGLDARIRYGLSHKRQIEDYIYTNDTTHNGTYNINLKELSNNDVKYVNESITNLLDTAEFTAYIHMFDGMAKDFDMANAYKKRDIIEKWKEKVAECGAHIRSNKIEMGDEEFFSLKPEIRNDYTRDTYSYLTNTSSMLYSGMRGMNILLGGGFQSTRVYSLFGLQGEGKSLTLMNLAYQIKMFNPKYKPKDPTKTPAVVYLTLENTKRESFTRLFSIATNGARVTDYTPEEDIAKMDDSGLSITDENNIDIIIKFKPNSSVTTDYLYELYDEMAEHGYEPICFLVDYTDVIRSIRRFSASEERLRLGAIINEFKAIATELDIPIITAGQLNRDANRAVDQARLDGVLDLNNYVSRSNLGESMKILNNLDGAFMITPSTIPYLNQKYLSIKLVKHRYDLNTKELGFKEELYHPYESMDSPRLVCDVGLKEPRYALSIEEKKVTTDVDDDMDVPDNSERCVNNKEFYPKNSKLLSDGTKPLYDTYWRTNPKKINNTVNVNAMSPVAQMNFKIKTNDWGNIMSSRINELNGISRYSDTYTKLYDPEGSKESRLAHDYNIKYGLSDDDKFTEDDYDKLYSHFMCLQEGLMVDSDEYEEPVKEFKPEQESIFTFIPEIDREALCEYLSVDKLIYTS